MNLWTGIALANLQRTRPSPRELEDKHVCIKCGDEKPESDFRFSDEGDYFLRDKMCRACRSADDVERRNAKRGHAVSRRLLGDEIRSMVLAHLTGNVATIRQLDSAISASRRSLERAVKALRGDGLVTQVGAKKMGTNNKIPIYGLTQAGAAPAERITN